MRNTFLPSIWPAPSPVDFSFDCSHSARVLKSLVRTSRLGSVFAGSPVRTAAMIRMNFKGASSVASWISRAAPRCPAGGTTRHKESPVKSLQRGQQSPGEAERKKAGHRLEYACGRFIALGELPHDPAPGWAN